MHYTISQVSKKFNIPPSTIRYYDKQGLLPFVKRNESGVRIFENEDFEWLKIIECLKNTGMPIKEIKKFIDYYIEGDSTIDKRIETINSHRNKVAKEIEKLKHNLEILDYKAWYYEMIKKYGNNYEKNIDKIPDKLKKAYLNLTNIDKPC